MNILREPTAEETKTMKPLKGTTAKTVFLARLAKIKLEHDKKYQPFCKPCAIKRFDVEMQRAIIEGEEGYGYTMPETDKRLIKLAESVSVEQFGDKKYFTLVGDRINRQKQLDPRGGVMFFEEVHKTYKCNSAAKHTITINPPRDEYESNEIKPKVK